jgi:hypothetical protein
MMSLFTELQTILGEDRGYDRVPTMDGTPFPTDEEQRQRLAWVFQGILGCGVHATALKHPGMVTADQICINAKLFERLFIAMAIIKDLNEYAADPGWMADTYTRTELQAALGEAIRRIEVNG